jgi:tetratricopeptide (TPR) repeat protein
MAQKKVLKIEEDTERNSAINIYSNDNENAFCAVFIADPDMALQFSSSYQRNNNIDILNLKDTIIGNERFYELVLPSELTKKGSQIYGSRILTVYADGFDAVNLSSFCSAPKTKVYYRVINEYKAAENPYFIAIDKATNYYSNGDYLNARTQYMLAKQYKEYEKSENKSLVDEAIANVDYIQQQKIDIAQAVSRSNWYKALGGCSNILRVNPADDQVRQQSENYAVSYNNDCSIFYQTAESFADINRLDSALRYYQMAIDLDCPNAGIAVTKSSIIKRKQAAKLYREHFFTIDYTTEGKMFGFTAGRYGEYKWKGYFRLSLNPNLVDLFSKSKYSVDKTYEAGIVLGGFTHKIVKPVWIHFSPFGYVGAAYFTPDPNITDAAEAAKGENLKWNFAHSWAPEVGIGIKLWYFQLRYTYQRRLVFQKKWDILGHDSHVLSIGVCW